MSSCQGTEENTDGWLRRPRLFSSGNQSPIVQIELLLPNNHGRWLKMKRWRNECAVRQLPLREQRPGWFGHGLCWCVWTEAGNNLMPHPPLYSHPTPILKSFLQQIQIVLVRPLPDCSQSLGSHYPQGSLFQSACPAEPTLQPYWHSTCVSSELKSREPLTAGHGAWSIYASS